MELLAELEMETHVDRCHHDTRKSALAAVGIAGPSAHTEGLDRHPLIPGHYPKTNYCSGKRAN